ncbi:MAG: hypothetical protein WDN29_07515 [Methylovirgula sp.]
MAAQVDAISRPMSHYVWYNADWKILADIDESRESISGGRHAYLANQPDLERVLARDLLGRRGGRVVPGQRGSIGRAGRLIARVIIAPFDAQTQEADLSKTERLSAKYVVGLRLAPTASCARLSDRRFSTMASTRNFWSSTFARTIRPPCNSPTPFNIAIPSGR